MQSEQEDVLPTGKISVGSDFLVGYALVAVGEVDDAAAGEGVLLKQYNAGIYNFSVYP